MAKKTTKKKTHQDRHTHTHSCLMHMYTNFFVAFHVCADVFCGVCFTCSGHTIFLQFSYNFRGCSQHEQHQHEDEHISCSNSPSLSFFHFFYLLLFLCWQIVRPVNAFLIVDVQNDFISGSLDISNCSAQQQGHEVSPPESLTSKWSWQWAAVKLHEQGHEGSQEGGVTGMRYAACGDGKT